MRGNTRRKTRGKAGGGINQKVLLLSLLWGVLYGVAGNVLYSVVCGITGSILFVGIYFLLMAVGVMAVLVASARLSVYGKPKGARPKIVAALLVLTLFGGILFEFLYELQGSEHAPAKSLIFALDDSGSMETNDPKNQRTAAVMEALEGYNASFPYAVYVFADDYACVRKMDKKSAGDLQDAMQSSGGTSIVGVLNGILDDIENGTLQAPNPRVILLSDGYATDAGFFDMNQKEVARRYRSAGIPIGIVGIGDADEKGLEEMAATTGGAYIGIDDVADLGKAMAEAGVSKSERNLLDVREPVSLDFLYALMRILFLAAIGSLIGLLKEESCEKITNVKKIFPVSVVCSVIGAVLMELLLTLFGVGGAIARLLLSILFCLTLVEAEGAEEGYDDASHKQWANQ